MRTIRLLAFLFALLPAIAGAQQFQNVPDHSVIGRIGSGSASGPAQAIPFATLTAQIVSGGIVIAPTPPSNNPGLTISQTTPNTGSVAGPTFLNSISVTDQAQTVTGSVLDGYGQITNQTSALRINHRVTGGSASHFGLSVASNITGTNGGTAAGVFGTYTNVGTITGDQWGLIGYATIGPSANLNQSAVAIEAEAVVANAGTVRDRIGLSINAQGQGKGTTTDAGLIFDLMANPVTGYTGTPAAFNDGLYFSSNFYGASAFPVATTGNIMRGDTGTVANFANFHTLTVSGNILDFPNAQLTGAGTLLLTSSSAGALRIGPNGTTNPTFQVDASASSAANGVYINSTAAGNGAQITTISSATNEKLGINARGSGTIDLAGVSTGGVTVHGSFTATGLVTLADLASGSVDTALGYWGSSTASANAINNCANALTYSTSTHTFGCNTLAGTGTVTTAGTALTLTGGGSTLNVTGSPVLLNTLTASNSATLGDTTSLTATYSMYELVFENIIPATAGQIFELQAHSGGSFQATSYVGSYVVTAAGAAFAGSTPTTYIGIGSASQNNTAPGISGRIRIHNPSSASATKQWLGETTGNGTTPNTLLAITSGWWNGGNGAIDGFQVLFASGNITSGVIKIYGYP